MEVGEGRLAVAAALEEAALAARGEDLWQSGARRAISFLFP